MFDLVACFFFFNDTATTEIYTLSLHDALPIYRFPSAEAPRRLEAVATCGHQPTTGENYGPRWSRRQGERLREERQGRARSEEHTSELQSRQYLVCRLLLEKKKKPKKHYRCLPL